MGQALGPNVPVSMAENLRGASYMLIAMAAFIPGDACMRAVTAELPLFQAVVIRSVITLPLLFLVARQFGGLQPGRLWRSRRLVGLRVLAEVGATLTFFIALPNLPFATLTAILQSAPLVVTAGAVLFMEEKVGWRRAVTIVIGFVGVLIIVRPEGEGINLFAVAALISVLFVAVRDLSTRRLPADIPSLGVAFMTAIGITLTFTVLSSAEAWQAVSLRAWGLILLAALLVNVGHVFMIMVMRVGEIGFTTPFRYTALVWALVLGWLIWGEWPDRLTLLGAGIVVASGVFLLLREAQLQRRARS